MNLLIGSIQLVKYTEQFLNQIYELCTYWEQQFYEKVTVFMICAISSTRLNLSSNHSWENLLIGSMSLEHNAIELILQKRTKI